MPVSGNPYSVLKRALQKTARDRLAVTKAMAAAVKGAIKDQFATGVDPYGRVQPERADGKPAMISKHLGNAIKVSPTASGIEGLGELKESSYTSVRGVTTRRAAKRQWLNAHQEGHEFPARQAGGQRLAFTAAGKLLGKKRARSMRRRGSNLSRMIGPNAKRVVVGQRESYWRELKRVAKLRGYIVTTKRHTVGRRVLKVRLIYPNAGLGPRWGGRIKTAVSDAEAKILRDAVEKG